MQRYIAYQENVKADRLALTGDEAYHAVVVMRLQKEGIFEAFDGVGNEFLCRAKDISPRQVVADILAQRSFAGEASIRITLAQSILKGKGTSLVLDSAVQLGAAGFIAFRSAHSVAKPGDAHLLNAKLLKAAQEASKQSGRSVIPRVDYLPTVDSLKNELKSTDAAILLSLGVDAMPIDRVLAKLPRNVRDILLLVGPEGGFSEEEEELFQGLGAVKTSLGPRRIRATLAGAVACSIIMYNFNQMSAEEKQWITVSSVK
jgi:16S rRNA (uracil1498-N3)-methyltransferase